MINEKSLTAVKNAKFSTQFCRPLYDSYCFSQILPSIEALFTGDFSKGLPSEVYGKYQKTYDHVVLLFLDGFGWTFFKKYLTTNPILQDLEKRGVASKLTSMFPSTTAAHVTCINTGLTPAESGLYEWFIFEPKLNDIIAPLPFCFAGERKPDTLPLDPNYLYPKQTIYHRLNERNIRSIVLSPASIANSTYTQSVLSGAKVFGYHNPKEAFETLLSHLNHQTYCYFYFGDIDAVGHRKRTDSAEFSQKIEEIVSEIGSFFKKLPQNTAVILTADHGMTNIDPETTYYLNKKVPNIEKHLLFGRRNKPLAPAGSCRDFFLHVRDECIHELKDILTHFLEEKAEVYLTQELIDAQFFGLNPTENFKSRVGNLVILPYKEESVWWYEKNRFEQNFHAAHGGLTREEMETLFLLVPAADS